jgi:hypothetical protein
MEKLQLQDTNKYVRDRDSKAIISSDKNLFEAYKAQRERAKQMQTSLDDINMLKNEMIEIKTLLTKILNTQGREA